MPQNEATITTMSPEEASALEREVILNGSNPDYVLPDGRTNREVWEANAARDAADREEARAFERKSLEVNTPRVETVAVSVTEQGQVVTTTVEERPAATQVVPGTVETMEGEPGPGVQLQPLEELPPGRMSGPSTSETPQTSA